MAGTTKNLDDFTEGIGGTQPFVVSSSLSNVIISNSSTTLDIHVTVKVSLVESAAISNLISGTIIPPRTTLVLLEHAPLKIKTGKASIYYDEPTANTDDIMTVTYTSS
jgi:hypothetical protein